MIQAQYKNNLQEIHEGVKTTGFSIEVNQSMFQMLTSNIYNDPILAVMREWSTNACDACIAADKPVKYYVNLPTLQNPTFYVRDYGTGISPENIEGLFSNLGASTKRNSNAYNGTLGIGRMAGLAVSNSFNVESYYNGTLYVYSITMKQGVPVTLHMGNFPTEEPNGLKMSVPVKHEDIKYFAEKANQLYKFFDHKPILNLDYINTELPILQKITDDWFITSESSSENYVVMSQIAYPIPRNTKINTYGFKKLIIKVPPGSVTFNPGRESLSLDDQTIYYINSLFEQIKNTYIKTTEEILRKQNSDKEVVETYINLSKIAVSDLIKEIDLLSFVSENLKSLIDNTSTNGFRYMHGINNYSLHIYNALTKNITASHKKSYKNTFAPQEIFDIRTFFINAKHVIIDQKSNFKKQLSEVFTNQDLIIWNKNKSNITLEESVKTSKEFLTALNIPFRLSSDIVDNSIQQKEKIERQGVYAYSLYSVGFCNSQKIDPKDLTAKPYLYVKLSNTTPIIEDKDKEFLDYQKIYSWLMRNKNYDKDIPEVKGVPKKYQDIVNKLDNWINFEDFIKNKLKTITFNIATKNRPMYNGALIDAKIINDSPKFIRDLYAEKQNYDNYIKSYNFLGSDILPFFLKFEITTQDYTPLYNIDYKQAQKIYPRYFSMVIPSSSSAYNNYFVDPEFGNYLAKLEEFYALHSLNQ